MPSQLLTNPKVSFIVSKPFTSRGKTYEVGDDFPQEDARDIDVFVRARFVKPVIEKAEDKKFIKQWHREIRTREEVMETLTRDRVQLKMHEEPDSDEVVNIPQLTHPEDTPEPEEPEEEPEEPSPAQAVHDDQYDPSYHTVVEVNAYLASADPEERERVLEAERNGKARKGILEA